MSNRSSKDNKERNSTKDDLTKKGGGKQGIDKDPAKEGSKSLINPVSETQKGKNKVDGDPSKESDRPIDEQIL